MANQIWKPVVGYEGRYDVSNLGNVRSYVGGIRYGKVKPPRLLRAVFDETRLYPSVNLSDGNRGNKVKQVHRLVAEAFISNPENKPFVNHKDGNKMNAKKSNLEWVTPKENQTHAYATGLKERPIGIKNSMNKLSEKDVLEIYHTKANAYLLATRYNVTRTCIQGIKNGRIWSQLTGQTFVLKGIRKFTDAEVLDIFNDSNSQSEIAKRYEVCQGVISSIKTGRTHSALTGKEYTGRKTYNYHGIEVQVGGRASSSSTRT